MHCATTAYAHTGQFAVHTHSSELGNAGCFENSFTTLRAYTNLLSSYKNSVIFLVCCLTITAFFPDPKNIPLSYPKLLCQCAWYWGLKSAKKHKLQTHGCHWSYCSSESRRFLFYLLKLLKYHFTWYLIEQILAKHNIDIKMIICGFIELEQPIAEFYN
jgi:hypothetical protein